MDKIQTICGGLVLFLYYFILMDLIFNRQKLAQSATRCFCAVLLLIVPIVSIIYRFDDVIPAMISAFLVTCIGTCAFYIFQIHQFDAVRAAEKKHSDKHECEIKKERRNYQKNVRNRHVSSRPSKRRLPAKCKQRQRQQTCLKQRIL